MLLTALLSLVHHHNVMTDGKLLSPPPTPYDDLTIIDPFEWVTLGSYECANCKARTHRMIPAGDELRYECTACGMEYRG